MLNLTCCKQTAVAPYHHGLIPQLKSASGGIFITGSRATLRLGPFSGRFATVRDCSHRKREVCGCRKLASVLRITSVGRDGKTSEDVTSPSRGKLLHFEVV